MPGLGVLDFPMGSRPVHGPFACQDRSPVNGATAVVVRANHPAINGGASIAEVRLVPVPCLLLPPAGGVRCFSHRASGIY